MSKRLEQLLKKREELSAQIQKIKGERGYPEEEGRYQKKNSPGGFGGGDDGERRVG